MMASLAGLLKEKGHRVTGSDQGVYPPMSSMLDQLGIEYASSFDPGNLHPAPDMVVVGNAISRGNEELEAVLDSGLRYTSSAVTIREEFLWDKHVLAVAGTHGEDDHGRDPRLAAGVRGVRAVLSGGRGGRELWPLVPSDRFRVLRDRGRRVRHRVLRQGPEDVALRAAHGGRDQRRIRSRRYLPRRSGVPIRIRAFRQTCAPHRRADRRLGNHGSARSVRALTRSGRVVRGRVPGRPWSPSLARAGDRAPRGRCRVRGVAGRPPP